MSGRCIERVSTDNILEQKFEYKEERISSREKILKIVAGKN